LSIQDSCVETDIDFDYSKLIFLICGRGAAAHGYPVLLRP